jgi:hypothetical protein
MEREPSTRNANQNLAVAIVDKRTAYDLWRAMRPYGFWVCDDGREVLFNRHYTPILQRYRGQPCWPADPNEWVKFEKQFWLYNDGTPPELVKARMNWLLAVWGMPPMPPQPSRCTSSGLSSIEQRKLPNPYTIPGAVN